MQVIFAFVLCFNFFGRLVRELWPNSSLFLLVLFPANLLPGYSVASTLKPFFPCNWLVNMLQVLLPKPTVFWAILCSFSLPHPTTPAVHSSSNSAGGTPGSWLWPLCRVSCCMVISCVLCEDTLKIQHEGEADAISPSLPGHCQPAPGLPPTTMPHFPRPLLQVWRHLCLSLPVWGNAIQHIAAVTLSRSFSLKWRVCWEA